MKFKNAPKITIAIEWKGRSVYKGKKLLNRWIRSFKANWHLQKPATSTLITNFLASTLTSIKPH